MKRNLRELSWDEFVQYLMLGDFDHLVDPAIKNYILCHNWTIGAPVYHGAPMEVELHAQD